MTPRVLIVDDEPTNRTLLQRMLEAEFDLEIVHAANGLEALDQLSRGPVAVMILDARMPVIDGVETLEMIRRSPDLATLPVCMLTAERREMLVKRALELGVSDFVLKPLNPRVVVPRIRRLLERNASLRLAGRGSFAFNESSHVLLVDEQETFRQFFADQVGLQCSVRTVATGIEALQSCLERPPSVVFVGEQIGLLGREHLAKKIRGLESCRSTMIVALTDGSDEACPPAECDETFVRSLDAPIFWSRFRATLCIEESVLLTAGSPAVRGVVAAITSTCRDLLDLECAVVPRTSDPLRRDWSGARIQVRGISVAAVIEYAMPEILVRLGLSRRRGAASANAFGQDDVNTAIETVTRAAGDALVAALAAQGTFAETGDLELLPSTAFAHGWSTAGDASDAFCTALVAQPRELCATLTMTTRSEPAKSA